MKPITVFADSDVIISSLLSKTGASYLLLQSKKTNLTISDLSIKELDRVVNKLRINTENLKNRIEALKIIVDTKKTTKAIEKEFGEYTSHKDDSHVVFGAIKSKAKFLITYNLKHYKRDKIKDELGVLVMTPALFLQYLRSRGMKI